MYHPNAIVSAVIANRLDAQGELIGSERLKTINDRQNLDHLLHFFPQFRTTEKSGPCGGWYPGMVIRFKTESQAELIVYIDTDLRTWREPQGGDWRLHRDFKPYIENLYND